MIVAAQSKSGATKNDPRILIRPQATLHEAGVYRVYLSETVFALVDEPDLDDVIQFTWRASFNPLTDKLYAYRTFKYYTGRKRKSGVEYLHRRIMAADKGVLVDHINGNTLDNRHINLRFSDFSGNSRNRLKNKNSLNRYKGVTRDRKRWRAKIVVDRRHICLGTFDTDREAAIAYDLAAVRYHGEFACLNSASDPSLPTAADLLLNSSFQGSAA